ncbi:hypothetical protein [Gordonia jinghuaiqii]|uniref:Uncharacterized protein n=1 Tax=Gordonia jinghuaiqii TaxID=2758710 RepID=A0A7D7QV52_9ACTN|nr:hypothetical protein [Gordonia jinghuaiqii]QMT00349.1 hypothetical protein H1R19_15680 [Gordonia jinghuaiqii]
MSGGVMRVDPGVLRSLANQTDDAASALLTADLGGKAQRREVRLPWAVFIPMGKLDLSLTPGQRAFFPVAVGIIVVAAIYGEYARNKHGPPRITLDIGALMLNRTSSQTSFPWADITRIDAERIGSWPKRDVVFIDSGR